ncbi:Cytochrome c oxidase assembly protein cox15 [Actinomortierella ambigua]|nr:Cytochrome c oxidase assembly protein cox15 [Actinomortierella ambigua]
MSATPTMLARALWKCSSSSAFASAPRSAQWLSRSFASTSQAIRGAPFTTTTPSTQLGVRSAAMSWVRKSPSELAFASNKLSLAQMTRARFQSTAAQQVGSPSTVATTATAATTAATAQATKVAKPIVGYWMLTISAMTFGIVVLGGVTRLTESGLSIVEWNVIKGMKPPRSQAEWEEEFNKYKQFPEYKVLNHGMTIEEFKRIFYYEWSHRMLGRAIGAAFILPGLYFAGRGMLSKQLSRRSLVIGALIGFQGALGWFMVKSGLNEELAQPGATPRVSQYRLAAHLGAAFLIYTATFVTGLKVLRDNAIAKGSYKSLATMINSPVLKRFKGGVHGVVAMVFFTVLSGAFVAGLDAGLVYNEFPTMGEGRLMPPVDELFDSRYLHKGDHPTFGLIRNMFDNQVTVQFNHRVMAMSTFTAVSALFLYSRGLPLPPQARLGVNLLMGVAIGQVGLGIATLLYMVPVSLGTAHQAGSLTLLTSALYLMQTLKKIPVK